MGKAQSRLQDTKTGRQGSKRRNWFEEWIGGNTLPTQEQILHFHQFTGDGDVHNDLRMNRDGKVFTVSVTSVEIGKNALAMDYLDLKNDQSSTVELGFESSIAGK